MSESDEQLPKESHFVDPKIMYYNGLKGGNVNTVFMTMQVGAEQKCLLMLPRNTRILPSAYRERETRFKVLV